MKNYAIFLLILMVFIFLAGCVSQQQPTQQGQAIGVIVKSFKPSQSQVYSGQSVSFFLTVENVGEEDAEEVKAVLTGLGTDWSGELNEMKEIGYLQKRLANFPGGLGEVEWEVTAPEGKEIKGAKATVKVYYLYKSTADGRIKIVSQDYSQTHPEDIKGIESFIATRAPIQISVGASRPFVYIKPGQQGSIRIELTNVGQGFPYVSEKNDRKVTIESITINGEECLNHDFPKIVRIDPSYPLTCQFTVPEVSEYTTIPLEVHLTYYYYVESTATIDVLKLE
jgi:hypothetical protein